MIHVLSFFWAPTVLAFAIGLSRGTWLHGPQPFHPVSAMRHRIVPMLMVLGAMASTFSIVGGRLALWLDIGLLLSASYIVGCYAGYAVSRWSGRRDATSDAAATTPARPSRAAAGEMDELGQMLSMDSVTRVRLRLLGIRRLDQVAGWTEAQARWIDAEFADLGANVSRAWLAEAREKLAQASTRSSEREVA